MFEVVVDQNFQNSGILDRSCCCILTLTSDILDLGQLNLNALENFQWYAIWPSYWSNIVWSTDPMFYQNNCPKNVDLCYFILAWRYVHHAPFNILAVLQPSCDRELWIFITQGHTLPKLKRHISGNKSLTVWSPVLISLSCSQSWFFSNYICLPSCRC
jgi:hypothetical protein